MKKRNILLGILLIAVLMFSGCAIKDVQIYVASGSGIGNVFRIGQLSCKKSEAKIYLSNYKNLYATYNETNLYGKDNKKQIDDAIKSAALTHLTKVYALNQYAIDNDISLSQEEKEGVEEAAKQYYASLNREEKRYTKATQKDIEKMYQKYALAEKVYVEQINSVDEEVSEDESRVMDAYVLFTKDRKLAKNLEKKVRDGATFERLASTYSKADNIRVSFGREEYPKEVDDVVFLLEDREVSSVISCDDGYYMFQCLNKYNEELSEQNKSKIIQERKAQAIRNIISQIDIKYYSALNKYAWEHLKMDTSSENKTNTFFSTLNEYVTF